MKRLCISKRLLRPTSLLLLITMMLMMLSSCLFDGTNSVGGRSQNYSGSGNGSGTQNSGGTANVGYAHILADNPIILSGDTNLPDNYQLELLLSKKETFITLKDNLVGSCQRIDLSHPINACYEVRTYKGADALVNTTHKWTYSIRSEEFLQVNTFAHAKIAYEAMMKRLDFAYTKSQNSSLYLTALPQNLYDASAHWYGKPLYVYSQCNVNPDRLAYFNPASYDVFFAPIAEIPLFRVNQDPTIIYHELSHTFTLNFINLRNIAAGILQRTDLGILGYDEANAINEGLADFYSYSINQRTHLGEWGIGRFFGGARAMTESDKMNAPGINKDQDSRLAYPEYLDYDINDHSIRSEGPHNGGQTTSYFLVALNEKLQESCKFTFDDSINVIYFTLIETLSNLGDLTSKGNNSNSLNAIPYNRINFAPIYDHLGRLESKFWVENINPISYRSFYQTFSRYLIDILGGRVTCNGSFTRDQLEQLLDMYGLLLFKTYNNNGNGYNTDCTSSDETVCELGHSTHSGQSSGEALVAVNPVNRKRTLLLPKKSLKLDPNPTAPKAYVFDNRESILNIVSSLKVDKTLGQISNLIPSDLRYNNFNGRISPGEIVGLALNLYNNSNATLAGVQVLANDWDHAKLEDPDLSEPFSGELKPCNTFEDEFPSEDEGAASADTLPYQKGDCHHITRTNGINSTATLPGLKDMVTPICMMQLRSTNETLWVSQERFREVMDLDRSECLMGEDSPYDCFIRVIPGNEQAYYSKIASKKTWAQTFTTPNGPPEWQGYHLILFEISPNIPPGTTFDCRFRARFTNCDDCWSDNSRSDYDDYLDYEYSGATPFKILHYQFTVID